MPRSHRVCGTISELLVAADLMARGYEVYIPLARTIGHDIIAEAPSGRLLTIEVRSAKRAANGALRFKRTTRSEMFAAVVTGEPVQYDPPLPE